MKKNSDTLLLYRIANYYYNQNMSQNEIACKENVSRSQISRLLIKAREMGLVKIQVELPETLSTQDLEQKLELLLNLQKVVVVPTTLTENLKTTEVEIIKSIATAASAQLSSFLGDAKTIGIGWGRTLYNTSLLLPVTPSEKERIFVPLIGNSGTQNPYLQTSSIVNHFAEKFMCSAYYLNFSCVQQQGTISSTYEDICIKQLNTYWDNLDAAVISLGIIPNSKNIYIAELPKSAVNVNHIKSSCGEILGQTIDSDGNFDWLGLDGYEFIGISLNRLKSLENVICIAGGVEKVLPIMVAAKSGFIKTLIIDDLTANLILKNV